MKTIEDYELSKTQIKACKDLEESFKRTKKCKNCQIKRYYAWISCLMNI